MSKGLVKSTVAVVVLALSLSISSVAFGATTTVEQSVNNVKKELIKATTYYVYPSLEGKLVSSSELYPVLNNAKKNYQNTRSAVVSSKIPSNKKKAILKEMDTLYQEKITEGLVGYIDAYNYATKYLDPLLVKIEDAKTQNDLATVEKLYHQLSYQLKGRSAILYRFSGKAARDLLLAKYKKTSDQKRDELIVPVTVYMKTLEVEKLVSEWRGQDAKKEMESIQALVELLHQSNSSTLINELVKLVEKEEEMVNMALLKQEEIPVAQPDDVVLKSIYTTGYEVKVNYSDIQIFNKEKIKVAEFEGNMFTLTSDLSDTALRKAARSISNISGRISFNDIYAFIKTASRGQIIKKDDMSLYTDGKKIIVSWNSNEQDLKLFLYRAVSIQFSLIPGNQIFRYPALEIEMQYNSFFTDTFIDRFIKERMTAEVKNGETKYYLREGRGHLTLAPVAWDRDAKVIRFEKNNVKYVEISVHSDPKSEAYVPHVFYIILREENGNYKVDDIQRISDEYGTEIFS